MVRGAGPEGDQIGRVPGEIETAVVLNGLPKPEHEPYPDGEHVVGEDYGPQHCPDAEEDSLHWMCILSGHPEWCSVLVMHLVDERVDLRPVQESVQPVEPEVLDDVEDRDLPKESMHGGQGELDSESHKLGHIVKEHHHGELDEDVVEEDEAEATHLLLPAPLPPRVGLGRLDLVLLQRWHQVGRCPQGTEPEVECLVEDESARPRYPPHADGRDHRPPQLLHGRPPGL